MSSSSSSSSSSSTSSSSSSTSSAAPHPSLQKYLDSPDFTRKALTIVVVGASGHLARNMVIPAIFSLFCKRLLPKHFHLVGYARSDMDDSTFRGDKLASGLKGHESHELHNMGEQHDQAGNDEKKEYRLVSSLLSMVGLSHDGSSSNSSEGRVSESDRTLRKQFLDRCYYVRGKYDEAADFKKLQQRLDEIEKQNEDGQSGDPAADGVNRIFYLAIPPPQHPPVLENIASIQAPGGGWTRVVVEKPFGEDLDSARKLIALVASKFKEEQIYRIDHFMGKDTLLNLLPLRFANRLYSEVWNKEHVSSIIVNVKESFGLEGRAGYFDTAGIIRDMIQNHLLSVVSLLTCEPPDSHDASALHAAKTAVFKAMKAAVEDDVVIGQYGASADGKKVGYAEDEGVQKDTKTPTYCAIVVHIDNERWRGVPILMQTGKGLDKTKSDIYINFKPVACQSMRAHIHNEQQSSSPALCAQLTLP